MHTSSFSSRPVRFLLVKLLVPLALVACARPAAPPAGQAPPSGNVQAAGITPTSFEDRQIATVSSPIDLAFTPDGRVLIATQSGRLRVYQNGALLSTPVLDLSGRACGSNGWGLLGVATDPNFASNQYIYAFYTSNKNGNCSQTWTNGPVNRVSRFTMSGNTASLSSEKVLIDNIPAYTGSHNGGALAFGADGKLYVSVGDGYCKVGGSTQCAGENPNSRSRAHLLGKILRVNKDGTIPGDNPFVNEAGARRCGDPSGMTSGSGPCVETYSWGLRNPFRMAFKPGTNDLYVNDVGQEVWEEVNVARSGADFGWNEREGNCVRNSTTNCGAPPAGMTNPVFSYGRHQTPFANCKSITGGAFVPAGVWPREYDGAYLFADYVCGKIFRLTPNTSGGFTASSFVTGLGESSAVALAFGPYNGSRALYYLSYAGGGEVRVVTYTGTANRAPVARASASPTSGALPLSVTLDASASSDPDGDPLSFRWDFGDGTASASGARVTHTYSSAGSFTARVTVTDDRGASATGTVRIDAGNTAPRVEILSPAATDTFRVGQSVTLQGRATDAEDGTLAGTRLSWKVELRHNDDHSHPVTAGSGAPSFTTPAPEGLAATARSYLLITLTATDSKGLSTTVTRKFEPRRVSVAFATQPGGLQLSVNGQGFTAPATFTSWEGYVLNVAAPAQQSSGGQAYAFRGWSDGGAASHAITTPAQGATFTATYDAQGALSVSSLTLINADTDQPVAGFNPIPPGALIVLSELPTRNVTVRANTTPGTVGSVRFTHDGSTVRTESYAPYTIAGDASRAGGGVDYWPWKLSLGGHTLTVTPYSGASATGTTGTPLTLNYTVQESRSSLAVSSATLINADTDQAIAGFDPIPQNAVIDLAALPTRNITVRANTAPGTVGSVRFTVDGATVRTESYAPYAIAGDARRSNGTIDYLPWRVANGQHELLITPYSAASGAGTAGTPLRLNFSVR